MNNNNNKKIIYILIFVTVLTLNWKKKFEWGHFFRFKIYGLMPKISA